MFWLCSGIVDLNPTDEVFLGCGPASPVSPDKVLDSLEANITIVWSEDRASKVVLISVDSLFLGSIVVDEICSGLSGFFSPAQIFLAASHTHTAPMIDETKPRLGIRNDDYAGVLVDKIVQAVSKLVLETPTSVRLRKYTSTFGGIVERRNNRLFELSRHGLKFRPTLQRPNLRKRAIGAETAIAEFLDDEGKVLAALGVIPCHPVALMGRGVISADYVSGLRAEFRERICEGREAPFVFLQGASGDLNPWSKPKWLDGGLVKVIDQLVNGVRFSFPAFSISELRTWCKLRVQEMVMDRSQHLRNTAPGIESQVLNSELHQFPLSGFLKDAVKLNSREVYLHQLQIGDLRLMGVSAEITSKLKEKLKDSLEGAELVGCIRDSFGYAATPQQYLEGGYEVDGHQWHFSIAHLEGVNPGNVLHQAIENVILRA